MRFLNPTETPGLGLPQQATNLGFVGWNFSVLFATGTALVPTAGTLYVQRFKCPRPTLITNLHVVVTTAGATLTAGRNFAGLYSAAGNLLSGTGDQTTAWQSTGLETMPLLAPQTVPAGEYFVAFYTNGTTKPTFARAGVAANVPINGVLSAANALWASANTGLTTALPATLGTFTATSNAFWVAVS